MHKFMWLAGLTLALGLTSSAHAQVITSGSMSGPTTGSLFGTFFASILGPSTPVDYRNANTPIASAMPRAGGFTLTQLFHTSTPLTTTTSNTIPTGTSTFPTPAQMQASAPSFMQPFQLYRGQRISP